MPNNVQVFLRGGIQLGINGDYDELTLDKMLREWSEAQKSGFTAPGGQRKEFRLVAPMEDGDGQVVIKVVDPSEIVAYVVRPVPKASTLARPSLVPAGTKGAVRLPIGP